MDMTMYTRFRFSKAFGYVVGNNDTLGGLDIENI